ncbi:MAG TPA: VWA domain-containing protein, partial [Pyrodictium sp.]|nr:VWA domain-containing protein [Pyrodictium sp.]
MSSLTKHLDTSLEIKGFSSDVVGLVYNVVNVLRREGVRVPTSKVVDCIAILSDYIAVRGFKSIDVAPLHEIAYVIYSVLGCKLEFRHFLAIFKNILQSSHRSTVRESMDFIRRELEKLGLHFGSSVKRSRTRFKGSEWVDAYAILKLLGLIRRDRRGERVVDEREASRRIKQLVKRHGSLDKALAEKVAEDARRGGYIASLLSPYTLKTISDNLSVDELVTIGRAALKNRNYVTAKFVADLVQERINGGELRVRDVLDAYELLRWADKLSTSTLLKLVSVDPKIVGKLEVEDIVKLLDKLDEKSLAVALKELNSKGHKYSKIVYNYAKRLPLTLSAQLAGASSLKRIGLALQYGIRALDEGNIGYVDMALAELSRARDHELSGLVLKFLKTIECVLEYGECSGELVDILYRIVNLRLISFEELLNIARATLKRVQLRSKAIYLAEHFYRLLTAHLGFRGELDASKTKTTSGARLLVRDTLYKIARLQDVRPVYECRRKVPGYVLVVDKSGSMRPYSVTATLTASMFATVIRRLVLFDSNVYIYDDVTRRGKRIVLDLLLSTEFNGYTNIAAALREASRGIKPTTLILLTDFRQTVYDEEPLEVLRSLLHNGWQVRVIAPPTIDQKLLKASEEMPGLRVTIIEKPVEIPKLIKRIIA